MNLPNQPPYNFQTGAFLLVDKPKGWTSFDVVNKIRYKLRHKLQVKKIKVGHAGTLDPMATGLLIICTGKMTKQIEKFQGMPKKYTGKITFGATTPSYDAETEPDETFPIDHLTEKLCLETIPQFLGEQEQIPPMFSAIKVDGQRLYKKARAGKKVELKPRPIVIYDFKLSDFTTTTVDFEVECSKGTYIRSLAYDFGKAVNSGAFLSNLCRTAIGEFKLSDAWTLEELLKHIDEN